MLIYHKINIIIKEQNPKQVELCATFGSSGSGKTRLLVEIMNIIKLNNKNNLQSSSSLDPFVINYLKNMLKPIQISVNYNANTGFVHGEIDVHPIAGYIYIYIFM